MSMTELNIDRLAESYYAEHDPEYDAVKHVDYFTGQMGFEEDMAMHTVDGDEVWVDRGLWRHHLIQAENKLNAFLGSLSDEEKATLADEMGDDALREILR